MRLQEICASMNLLLTPDSDDAASPAKPPAAGRKVGGGRYTLIKLLGQGGMDRNAIDAAFKSNDGNQVVIVAYGNRITHLINDVVATELEDQNESVRPKSGMVALKAWFRGREEHRCERPKHGVGSVHNSVRE